MVRKILSVLAVLVTFAVAAQAQPVWNLTAERLQLPTATAPVNSAAATATLTFAGVVADAQTVTIGTRVYEFDTALAAATATLTISGTTSDTETVTLGSRVYEFDTGGAVTAGRVLVDISGGNSAAQSVTALVAAIEADASAVFGAADGAGDTVVVTADTKGTAGNVATTETCANAAWGGLLATGGADAAVTAGRVAVDVSGGVSAAAAVTALAAAIQADASAVFGAVDGAGDTVVITADTRGTAGNVATTETCTNASWGGLVAAGGVDATPCLANQVILRSDYLYACTATSSAVSHQNWRRVALGSAY